MRRSMAIVLSLAVAAPAIATSYEPVTVITTESIKKDRKRERERQSFCRKVRKSGGNLTKFLPKDENDSDRLVGYSYLLEAGEDGCPKNLDLAIALVEMAFEGKSPLDASDSALARLNELLRQRGGPSDLVRARDLQRYLWIRGGWSASDPPAWSDAERRDFAARDDVWAYTNKLIESQFAGDRSAAFQFRAAVLLDPLSNRFDPAAAINLFERRGDVGETVKAARVLLDGRLVPADPPRAEALLWRVAMQSDEAVLMLFDLHQSELANKDPAIRRPVIARLLPFIERYPPRDAALRERMVPFLVFDLADPDPAVQSADAAHLALLGEQGTSAAVAPLLRWLEPQLVSPDKARSLFARTLLARLVMADIAPAHAAMTREYARHGGLVEAGAWTLDPAKPASFDRYFTTYDYPLRALREERSGVVRATAVFGPDGKVLFVDVNGSSGHADLDQMVRSILQRRMRRSWPEHSGRYVRVKLPPIQFRIADCDGNFAVAPLEGAAVVDGIPNCRTVY